MHVHWREGVMDADYLWCHNLSAQSIAEDRKCALCGKKFRLFQCSIFPTFPKKTVNNKATIIPHCRSLHTQRLIRGWNLAQIPHGIFTRKTGSEKRWGGWATDPRVKQNPDANLTTVFLLPDHNLCTQYHHYVCYLALCTCNQLTVGLTGCLCAQAPYLCAWSQ